ncbi:MAG: serine/threonine protein kinase [Planctomycetes bacterium]|nr:serine/threonine protein kinase [Planctomycetota bacterium]
MADPAITTECPTPAELEKLLRGRCTETRNAALCEHVGACPECQKRLDRLSGSAAEFADHLREAESEQPPSESAYWRALAVAEEELRQTALFPVDGSPTDTPPPDGDIKLDFLQPPDKPNRLGKLAGFDIVRVVGRGGMGVVLHGYDPSLQRDIAIKVIDPQLANNEVARQRFCREARAAAAVTHDNLVAVHQVNEDEPSGLPYLVMQLVNGESLEQRLKRAGRLSVPEVARLGMQAAAGLAAAHAGGLIHRDIKPANILLESPTDRVKLTDFGLARAAEDVKLTRTGFVAGSPLYMAPEQARGDEIDARADLFSLGTVLYEATTGTAPFEAKTPLAVLRRVSDETQMPLMRINPDVPKWLSDVVDKLLAKEPEGRYQSAAEVASVFADGLAEMHLLSPLDVPAEVCAGSSRTSTRTPICWAKVGHRASPWVGGTLAGALFVGLIWALTGSEQPHTAEPPPNHTAAPPEGAVATVGELSKKLEDPKTAEVVLGPGTFDLSALNRSALAGRRVELVVPAPSPTRLVLGSDPGPAPRMTLPGDSGAVWVITFLDADRVVVGTESGGLKIWDLKKGTVLKSLAQEDGPSPNIWSADVSADGKYLMTASDDSAVTFWNLDKLQAEFTFPESIATKTAVFSPCGKFLATGNRNSTVKIWDWAHQIPLVELRHRGTVHSLSYSPDGKRLASAGSDGKVKVWDMKEVNWEKREGPTRSMEMAEHRGAVYSVTFCPKGTRLASAGYDGTVRIWDAANGTQVQQIKAHDRDAWSVSFGNEGKWLASCGSDGFVKVWDVDTGKEVFSYHGPTAFHVVRFAHDGTTLAAGGRDGTVRVWDIKK